MNKQRNDLLASMDECLKDVEAHNPEKFKEAEDLFVGGKTLLVGFEINKIDELIENAEDELQTVKAQLEELKEAGNPLADFDAIVKAKDSWAALGPYAELFQKAVDGLKGKNRMLEELAGAGAPGAFSLDDIIKKEMAVVREDTRPSSDSDDEHDDSSSDWDDF